MPTLNLAIHQAECWQPPFCSQDSTKSQFCVLSPAVQYGPAFCVRSLAICQGSCHHHRYAQGADHRMGKWVGEAPRALGVQQAAGVSVDEASPGAHWWASWRSPTVNRTQLAGSMSLQGPPSPSCIPPSCSPNYPHLQSFNSWLSTLDGSKEKWTSLAASHIAGGAGWSLTVSLPTWEKLQSEEGSHQGLYTYYLMHGWTRLPWTSWHMVLDPTSPTKVLFP